MLVVFESERASDLYSKLCERNKKDIQQFYTEFKKNITYKMVHRYYLDNIFNGNLLTNEEQKKTESIKNKCKELAHLLVDIIPESRELSTALTSLETTMFFASAGIHRNQGDFK